MIAHSARRSESGIRARAPLRLGLGGGGSDLSPYCDRFGGAVVNVTIDKFSDAAIHHRRDSLVRFVALDSGRAWQGTADEALQPQDALTLHGGVYRRMVRDFNGGRPVAITLETSSEAPPGSGLGASSALVVTMVKAFAECLGLDLGAYEIARLAFEIERHDLALAGGRQDQYAAAFGGFNFVEFHPGDRVVVTPVVASPGTLQRLEASLMLFYTGMSRDSASIIAEQQRRLGAETERGALEAMHAIKAGALRLRHSLAEGNLAEFYGIINESWQAKKRTAHQVSNGHIDRICDGALEAGAAAAKVSGAGGGGFVVLFVEPGRRASVLEALRTFSGEITACRFTTRGVHAWQIADAPMAMDASGARR